MMFMVIIALFLYTMVVWGSKKVVKRGNWYYVKSFHTYKDIYTSGCWWSSQSDVRSYCRINTEEEAINIAFGQSGDQKEEVIKRCGPENPLSQLLKHICNYIKECE